jgi:hypothetical protein
MSGVHPNRKGADGAKSARDTSSPETFGGDLAFDSRSARPTQLKSISAMSTKQLFEPRWPCIGSAFQIVGHKREAIALKTIKHLRHLRGIWQFCKFAVEEAKFYLSAAEFFTIEFD